MKVPPCCSACILRQASPFSNRPKARDFTNKKGFRNKELTERGREKNRRKSSVRAKVEHAFLIIKRIFGFAKVSYRGLMKNGCWQSMAPDV